MANPERLEEQHEEICSVAGELLKGGDDPDAPYTVEYHLSVDDLETLEKAAAGASKLGYETTDPEELEVRDDDIAICCDILSECAPNADLIDTQIGRLMTLAEKLNVEYDSWDTHSEDPNSGDGDNEDFVGKDDDGTRHQLSVDDKGCVA